LPDDEKKPRQWKLIELLNWTSGYLAQKGIENSRLQSERLLAFVLKMTRVELYLNFDRPLHPAELATFKLLLQRSVAHEPLQYILGETEFLSLIFKVEPGVLIPRPETEILVEKAIQVCRQQYKDMKQIAVLDVGTGSGCIAVSIAKNVENAYIVAVDVSQEALTIARQNAEFHAVQKSVEFQRLDALQQWPEQFHNAFDLVVCNPPYVREQEYANLDAQIRLYEPECALRAGADGLHFYREFVNYLEYIRKPTSFALFEIGFNMTEEVMTLFKATRYADATLFQDLTGNDRVLQLQYDEKS
jgi:release factor glutamine methyltransferase